jgi:hypothetical protein
MTDRLAAAAAALGVPEPLVRRSAEARAKAAGTSTDEVLNAWAGGGAVAPSAAPAPSAPSPSPDTEAETTAAATAVAVLEPPIVEPLVPASAGPIPSPGPVGTPVLRSPREGIGGLYAGVMTVLAVTLLLGFLVPGLAGKGDEVRSSSLPYTEAALRGQQAYLEQGCGSCHTQMIRPVVADAGLGPVTLADSNQVLGYRRVGPDLAAIGSRTEDEATIRTLLTAGAIEHPANGALSEADLDDLLAYLMESK